MKTFPLLTKTRRVALVAITSAALIAGAVVVPSASADVRHARAASGPAATSFIPNSSGQLPHLGFSLNGEALSGPPSASHYRTLSQMSGETVWARMGINSDGKWQEELDKYLVPIRNAGMKVLLRASFREAVLLKRVPLNATEQARYGDFIRELAQYVKTKYGLTPDDVVFEHPNESNRQVSAADYAGAAKNAYPKLKSVDPNYKIIGASENVYVSNWQTWLEDVYKHGYAKAADGVSFHNYDAQGSHSRYEFLESVMKRYGHWPAMVWLSEFGATTPPGAKGDGTEAAGRAAQTEAGQAVRLPGVLEFLRDEYPWITHAFLYSDEDISARKSSNPFEAYFGIFANDASGTIVREKPAAQAIRDLYKRQAQESVPAPDVPVGDPASGPSGVIRNQTQTLATFPLTSNAPSAVALGVTASRVSGTGFPSGPRYADFSPSYQRSVMQMNPTSRTASTNAAYVETVLTPVVASDTVQVNSIQLKAARGGTAAPRGLLVVAVVDGVATSLLSQDLATQRPTLSTIDLNNLSLRGKEVRIRVHPYSPEAGATVEMADLVITGQIAG